MNVFLINFYTWHGGVFTWPSSSSILIRGVQDNHLYPCQMGFTNLIANKWSHKVNEINYGQLGYYTYIGKVSTYNIENMYYICTISCLTELFSLKSKIVARSRNKNEFEGNKPTIRYVCMGKKVHIQSPDDSFGGMKE